MDSFYSIQSGNGEFIDKALSLVQADEHRLAFIALDISNFKYINDFYGMPEGDKVMDDIASFFFIDEPLCLAAYGMGFDQFRGIYSVNHLSKQNLVDYLAEKSKEFEKMLASRYPLVYNHVYVGIYFYEDTSVDVRIATDRSNLAKKTIKGNFNTNCQVFTDTDSVKHLDNMHMANLFTYASQNGGIELFLQPKVSVSRNRVVGAEALVRMKDEQGGLIMPGRFVPTLEKIGLIDRLDRIMIEKVFQHQRYCLDNGKNVYTISVNVSKQEFTSVRFAQMIFELQNRYQIDPSLVEFELLESTFVNNLSSIIDTIDCLRSEGFQISVDDFGAGYSSLNQVANIPADIIKLDGMFARESLKTPKGRAVIKSLISMLKDVDYDVVFEGVETQEQLDFVFSFGCDTVQGFYYSFPLAAKDFLENYGERATIVKQEAK